MSGMSDGVSVCWLIKPTRDGSLNIQGCRSPAAAGWYSVVWSAGYGEGQQDRMREGIAELERAVAELKQRVVEDYELESYEQKKVRE